MQTVTLSLTKDTWTQVPVVSGVTINHREGGTVAYAIADTVPSGFSPTSPVLGTSRFGESRTVDGFGSTLWVYAISADATITATELATSSSAVVKYDGVATPLLNSTSKTQAELFTYIGMRFGHQFVLDFTSSNEIKYLLYTTPTTESGDFLAVQERIFKSYNGGAELSVLNNSTGAAIGTEFELAFNENRMSTKVTTTKSANLTDSDGTEPTIDGPVFEVDFIAEAGRGSNTSGGISSLSGSRIYPPNSQTVIKIQNKHNGANKISLSYSWFEIPTDYI